MTINYQELETMLDRPKGEESVFRLFEEGRYDDLRHIKKIFLDTGLYDVSVLNGFLTREGVQPRVRSVFGEKGMGKSTLASVLALNSYIEGRIDDLRYIRYDPATKRFVELFKAQNEKPSKRVLIFDDVSYFVPDFINGALIKGSVQCFDRFVRDLLKLDLLFNESKSVNSSLLYISDAQSMKAMQNFFDGVLRAADREDIAQLLPKIPLKTEVNVNKEFYGKTYAQLNGDINLYTAADLFGEMISKDANALYSPRLLKYIIKALLPHAKEIDYRLFLDKEIIRKIVDGKAISSDDIFLHLSQRGRWETAEFCRQIEDAKSEAAEILSELHEDVLGSNEDLKTRILDMSRKSYNESKSYASSSYLPAPEDGAPLDVQSFIDRVMCDGSYSREAGGELSKCLLGSSERIRDSVKSMEQSVVGMLGKMRVVRDDLKKLGEKTEALSDRHERKLDEIMELISHYRSVPLKPAELEMYSTIFAGVKVSTEKFVSENSSMFSTADTQRVRRVVSDPGGAIRNINPYTIDLIRNLDVIQLCITNSST